MALQNANEDKRRTINEFQMRIQDLTTQIQRLEAKNQEDILERKLQLEKEHIVNFIFILITIKSKILFIESNQRIKKSTYGRHTWSTTCL
jgi:hypothetical protein